MFKLFNTVVAHGDLFMHYKLSSRGNGCEIDRFFRI